MTLPKLETRASFPTNNPANTGRRRRRWTSNESALVGGLVLAWVKRILYPNTGQTTYSNEDGGGHVCGLKTSFSVVIFFNK